MQSSGTDGVIPLSTWTPAAQSLPMLVTTLAYSHLPPSRQLLPMQTRPNTAGLCLRPPTMQTSFQSRNRGMVGGCASWRGAGDTPAIQVRTCPLGGSHNCAYARYPQLCRAPQLHLIIFHPGMQYSERVTYPLRTPSGEPFPTPLAHVTAVGLSRQFSHIHMGVTACRTLHECGSVSRHMADEPRIYGQCRLHDTQSHCQQLISRLQPCPNAASRRWPSHSLQLI